MRGIPSPSQLPAAVGPTLRTPALANSRSCQPEENDSGKIICLFLKILLDNARLLRYNSQRSRGQNAFFAHYGERVEAEIISPDKTPDLPNFAETFARQSSWEWNFGQAPAFSHLLDERFSWGGVELHFDVEKGHITRAQVFTDSLNPAPLEALAGRLQGCLYRADMLQQECEALLVDFPDQEKELRELSTWIAGAVR